MDGGLPNPIRAPPTSREEPVADQTALDGLVSGAEVKMDAKGRILVPKAIRDRLGSRFVLGLGQLGCLALYTQENWETLLAMVRSLPSFSPERTSLERMLVGSAREVELDSASRLLVPPPLRSFAKLRDRVMLVGLTEHVEVWSSEEYEAFQRDPLGYDPQRQQAYREAFEPLRPRP
jgi:MraZ protein